MDNVTFTGGAIYPASEITLDETTYFMVKLSEGGAKRLVVKGDTTGFEGQAQDDLFVCPLSPRNARILRDRLDWLNPVALGRKTSFGFGDRLGVATPGHIASKRTFMQDKTIAPIFAQQSVRENERTGRTPQSVLDDAMWGVFQEGWTEPWGADADHVKEVEDLRPFILAGYTFYTIDPSDYVDNAAQTDSFNALSYKVGKLPWNEMRTTYTAMQAAYCDAPIQVGSLTLTFDEESLMRALAKYGRAILHTAVIAKALNTKMSGHRYDLEMSVDETDTPTSIHEHYFIANELLKRKIRVVSLAPRFVGKFQKGVDYIGDIEEFEAELIKHVAILQHFNKYKISVHTGSDKFSIYGIINQHAWGNVHVKTAGTSYLEALRVISAADPVLFRKMLDLAHLSFEKDRKRYFLDCQPAKVPMSADLSDDQLPDLLEQFDARQLLHVTYGSILDAYGTELQAFLNAHEVEYQVALEKHFAKHLRPFTQ